MDYSASSVKYLLWFMETRETVRLRKDHAPEKVREMVIEENIYQQKDRRRIIEEYGCISRRIDAMPEGRVALATDVEVKETIPSEKALTLATYVKAALLQGKTLYVALDNVGEQYFCDGVFSKELQVLTEAVDSMPVDLRRYASFGFCVDEHFADVFEELLVGVFVAYGDDFRLLRSVLSTG